MLTNMHLVVLHDRCMKNHMLTQTVLLGKRNFCNKILVSVNFYAFTFTSSAYVVIFCAIFDIPIFGNTSLSMSMKQ
jgi:hypothetical protein